MTTEEIELRKANLDLQERLRTAEETLDAIRKGDVDAIVVKGPKGEQLYSLISPDYPYQVFIENMDEAAVILSKEGTILYGNRGFFHMIGSNSENVMGGSILDFVNERDKAFFMESLKTARKKKSEFSFLTKSRTPLVVSVSFSMGVWNDSEQLCLILTDITKLKRAQRLMEASESVTRILSESSSLSVASNLIIQLLKTYLHWDVLIVWIWNKEKRVLQCVEIAHVPDIAIDAFSEKIKELETAKALLSSHVWSSCRPVWIEDITEDSTFFRRREAMQCGLKGAFAFPFYQDSRQMGVIELFRRTPFDEEVDDSLLNLISSIGIEVGLYMQRMFVEETKLQLATVLRQSLTSIYSTDLNWIVTSWNPGAEKIYGWSAQEMIGSSIKKIYPNDKLPEFDFIQNTIFSEKPIVGLETQRLRRDGKRIWIESSYEVIHDPFGKLSGLCAVQKDITRQKELAETLEESEKKFKAFIEITEDWIWEIDRECTFRFSNQAVFTILGYETEEMIGKSLLYFLSFAEREKFENQLKANVKKKLGWLHLNIPFVHKNGSVCWLENNASVLLDTNQELIGFRGASRDITESKRLEKVKNEFISIVNHELRTPLTSIYGALSLLTSKEMTPEETKDLIALAQRNSIRLTKIINDIVDIEQIQLGKLSFDFKKINLKDVVLESIHTSELASKKFDVKVITSKDLPDAVVSGDYLRLLQVMTNLLSNAIKFSPHQGVVTIEMTLHQDFVRVSIKDCGEGIPKDFQSKIFEKFAQADSSAKRSTEGTGLGLNISKSIVEGHGGTIQYETTVGLGTTFFFDIPLYKEK